ncbi:MAG: hypothetical protein U0228_07910 [Myxococcaceae bacterium]
MSDDAAPESKAPQMDQLDQAPPISAELRAKILSDPNVAKLAASLEVSLDEFVNQIGYFMNHRDTEPLFAVVKDDDLRKMGVEPPSAEAIEANVRATVAAIQAGQAPSGFTAHKKNTVEMPSAGGDQVKPDKVDPELEDTVKKVRFPTKG